MRIVFLFSALFCLLSVNLSAQTATDPNEPYPKNRLGGKFVDRLVPIEGGQLCCAHRPGNGPNLILIPGTFSDSRVYNMLAANLDPEFNLVIIENRGLGKSWPPPENGSIEQCGRDALIIADHLGLKNFYVGGHSLGGMISLELGKTVPERVQGIISIEGWTSWHAARDAFNYKMKSTLSDDLLKQSAEYRAETLKNWTKEQEKQFGRVWRNWDCHDFLKSTEIPILEMYGDRGKTPATKKQLRIPDRENIQLVWYKNASHKLLIEKPKDIARDINQFVHELEK